MTDHTLIQRTTETITDKWLYCLPEKAKQQQGENRSKTEGLSPNVARRWVGVEIKITKAVLLAMNN